MFNLFKKDKNDEQLSIKEKWKLDSESYKNSNYKVKTGECQCYNCVNKISGNTLKCSIFENIPKDILFNKKECEYRIERKEN